MKIFSYTRTCFLFAPSLETVQPSYRAHRLWGQLIASYVDRPVVKQHGAAEANLTKGRDMMEAVTHLKGAVGRARRHK